MKKGLVILLAAFNWLGSGAQSTTRSYLELSGKVTDTAGIALSQATIQLTFGTDTLTTLSRDDGNFVFSHPLLKKFRLLVTMRGYLPFSQMYSIPDSESTLELKPIALRVDYSELDPVIVSRVRPITIQEDTISYNVAAFPVPDGSEVEDILKRLPGVEVDIDGNVIIQGKKIERVLVNGKEFFGNDLLLAIRNIPADAADKLQLIDDYGDQARITGVRSGVPTKVLNISLKRDKRTGLFGQAEAAGGGEGRYQSDAFTDAFRGDRQMSARTGSSNNSPAGSDPCWNAGADYTNQWNARLGGFITANASSESPNSVSSIVQNTYFPTEQLQESEKNRNSIHNNNNGMDSRLTYKPDKYSLLRLNISGAFQESRALVSSQFTTLEVDSAYTKTSNGSTLNNSQSASQKPDRGTLLGEEGLFISQASIYHRRRPWQ